MVRLFEQKKDCCGCLACKNVCPKQAVTVKPDENGFIYPQINEELCIECGLCDKVCDFKKATVDGNIPLYTYAAINKNKRVLANSASGGAFGALSNFVFDRGGVVFGCAYDDKMYPKHVCIDNLAYLEKIQGSKYVQSDIDDTYIQAENYLKNGKWVLFTGTPCQIAGLKAYLRKDYDRLITIDLICHGVPSVSFFKGYIRYLEGKYKGEIINFKFRDKSKGWGLISEVVYKKHSKILNRVIYPVESYYYTYFLNGDIYRESCYECKYAGKVRVGDFTIGDYWGVEKVHPEINTKNGVSVLLVNSQKGSMIAGELANYLYLTESSFEQAKIYNAQLNSPVKKSLNREAIFKTWREGGYRAVAKKYYKANKWKIIFARVKRLIPNPVKKYLKKMIKRG